jgi:hypothetical protein
LKWAFQADYRYYREHSILDFPPSQTSGPVHGYCSGPAYPVLRFLEKSVRQSGIPYESAARTRAQGFLIFLIIQITGKTSILTDGTGDTFASVCLHVHRQTRITMVNGIIVTFIPGQIRSGRWRTDQSFFTRCTFPGMHRWEKSSSYDVQTGSVLSRGSDIVYMKRYVSL